MPLVTGRSVSKRSKARFACGSVKTPRAGRSSARRAENRGGALPCAPSGSARRSVLDVKNAGRPRRHGFSRTSLVGTISGAGGFPRPDQGQHLLTIRIHGEGGIFHRNHCVTPSVGLSEWVLRTRLTSSLMSPRD